MNCGFPDLMLPESRGRATRGGNGPLILSCTITPPPTPALHHDPPPLPSNTPPPAPNLRIPIPQPINPSRPLPPSPPPPLLDPGRVFIASNHCNSESILRSHWSDAVTRLIVRLGVGNVYFSLYESGSWDDTKGARYARSTSDWKGWALSGG